MSTKGSIAYGEGFHLYEELMEYMLDGEMKSVHLELTGVDFESSPNGVTVAIPLEIWEYIRRFSPVSYKFAELSDDALYQQAKVDAERRSQHKWRKETKPLQESIDDTFESYKKARARQQKMKEQLQDKLGDNPEQSLYYKG